MWAVCATAYAVLRSEKNEEDIFLRAVCGYAEAVTSCNNKIKGGYSK